MGPEPLDKSFNVIKFVKLIKSQKRKIKQVLMDQEIIAGIGNIYSDEILWQAKINPLRQTYKLKTYELKNLYKAMKEILEKAVKLRGTSISDFRDAFGKLGGYAKMLKFTPTPNENRCFLCKKIIILVMVWGFISMKANLVHVAGV